VDTQFSNPFFLEITISFLVLFLGALIFFMMHQTFEVVKMQEIEQRMYEYYQNIIRNLRMEIEKES